MDISPLSIVKEAYERYSRRDFSGVFQLLSEEIVVWQTPELPWGGEHTGTDGARRFFASLAEHTTATPTPGVFIPAGKHVAVQGRLKGTANASGKSFDIPIVHLWQVQNGKIDRFEAFIDTPAMLEALSVDQS